MISDTVLGLIGVVGSLGLMAMGMPIGFAMLICGLLGYIYVMGAEGGFHNAAVVAYRTIANYDLCVIPLFVFMAAIILRTGFASRLFRMVYYWIGFLRGGLAAATIGACAFFAAASASSVATAVTIGSVTFPEMKKYGYDDGFASGTIAAGGTLGILIPPSGVLIMYGVMAQQSIAELFVAGIVPGIIMSSAFIAYILTKGKIRPQIAPPGPRFSFKERLGQVANTWEMLSLIVFVIGGLIVGWFTPSEAGAAGAAGAIALSLVRRTLGWEALKEAVWETLLTTGMMYTILMGAQILGSFVTLTALPMELGNWVASLGLPPKLKLMMIISVYLILGCFIDAMTMILLTIPVFYPAIIQLGFDPICFGIIVVIVTEMALITPPVGMNVFVVSGITGLPVKVVFKDIWPFVGIMFAIACALVFAPSIALILTRIV
jgi:tripartite ATP-independent transporter DctM subunit